MTHEFIPQQWSSDFEERLFIEVARRHVPDFPDKLAAPPRAPQNDRELNAVRDYYTRMASHDLFIVQVVARAIDTLFADDPHFQLILARQLGDDGAHASIARERIIALTGVDPLPEVQALVAQHWKRIGDLAVRDLAGFLAFEWHYELHILAKLWIQRKTGTIADPAMREHGENRIRPDEEWHRVQIVQWWQARLAATPSARRDALIEAIVAADDEAQRRLDGYLHDEYAHTALVFGADIAAYPAIYDDWRREILGRLTGRDPSTLSSLAPLSIPAETETA
ncbi:hypothetical protein J8I87_06375 [Paraburkholderia sp. LEh10]|jgi:hypothetical protein|uniref:hypothetical protein n=1 Tax=Paraburkholderia sp. LEh10 TaxID=2821353 RepID=UPI001AE2BA4F|nr:hypothetical protein [Paraburkholderia sp. LEh10]MBP0589349.1 hypothetical protein [Paraburkholderia sp. LEh10]